MTQKDGGTDRKEYMMIKKCLLAALLLGMTVAGCDDGSTDDAQGGQPSTFTLIDIDGINSTESWNAAVSRIKNGANNESYRLVITGDFGVPGSTASTFGSRKGLYVEIAGQGTGRKISLTSNGTMLRIGTDQHLTLKDITLQGKTDNNDSLVWVTSGALEMEGSAAVSGNKASDFGGGVWLSESTMTMSGTAAISGNTARYGGGVSLSESTMTMSGTAAISGNTAGDGGGVNLSKSTMTMNDSAVISGNTANYGGGVYLYESSTMTMNGYAAISGNEASYRGGGVYLSGSMTMNGNAAISGNTASSNSVGGGGGVFVDNSTMTMNDNAVISDNKAEYGGGGGVFSSGSTMTMNGNAAISGNTARFGGGVYVSFGYFRMTGGTVYGNTESVSNRNTAADGGASLYLDGGTAQYGTVNGSMWSYKGTLATGNNTIKVVNGELK